ncbi:sigma-70 family RNA polymerase sigma factor [Solibacillus silvestris]|uniref:sigma-70 family RNA polymerase sigma factor n=1 Tax=Solibacillus silvestris TaxID=76853 RepID=UPI003F803912
MKCAEELLILRVKQGDDEAFYELIQPIYSDLYRMAFVYIQSEADAVDILQQAIIKAYEHIHNLKEPQFFKTWMIRIVINCSKTYIEKIKRFEVTDPLKLIDMQATSNTYKEEEIDLWNALQSLEEKYKTVLLLRFYQDYTVPVIASIVELPAGTVKTNIRRGLMQLKQLLKGVYMDEWLQSIEGNAQ